MDDAALVQSGVFPNEDGISLRIVDGCADPRTSFGHFHHKLSRAADDKVAAV